MPLYKYIANRFLTLIENIGLGVKLSEYHTGFAHLPGRYWRPCLSEKNSDDFVFDSEMLVQSVYSSASDSEN